MTRKLHSGARHRQSHAEGSLSIDGSQETTVARERHRSALTLRPMEARCSLQAIEKTEAAKGELLSRARLLGVEDDERHPEAPKFSRKELPFEFGRKRQRK